MLSELKFIQIYNDNKESILNCRKEFESNLGIQKTIDICRSLCREDKLDEEPINADRYPDVNPF